MLYAAAVTLLAACGSYEDRRIRELLVEKGFGTRAEGEATVENYVAGGDWVNFTVSPSVLQSPSAQQLFYLTQSQQVAIDGTIYVPYYGRMHVLGKTQTELARLVESELQPFFPFVVDVDAHIVLDQKNIYAFGETVMRGVVPFALIGGADVTLLKAIARIGWTNLANIARVFVIRPDAEHPLVIEVNVMEIITTGYTGRNIRLRENDIIYVPPTFMGLIARILERLFAPVNMLVRTMFDIANVRTSYEIATGQSDVFFYRF